MPSALAPIVLLTRPAAQAQRYAATLPVEVTRHAQIIESPVLEIRQGAPIPDLAPFKGVILTSRNAVDALVAQGTLYTGPVYSIGRATTLAALKAGLRALAVGANADQLVATLIQQRPETPLVHLHGRHTRGQIAARLTKAGLPTTGIEIYDQISLPPSPEARFALTGQAPVILPLFSPRSAELVAAWGKTKAPLYVVCLSSAVAEAVQVQTAQELIIAARPEAAAMTATIRSLVARLRSGEV